MVLGRSLVCWCWWCWRCCWRCGWYWLICCWWFFVFVCFIVVVLWFGCCSVGCCGCSVGVERLGCWGDCWWSCGWGWRFSCFCVLVNWLLKYWLVILVFLVCVWLGFDGFRGRLVRYRDGSVCFWWGMLVCLVNGGVGCFCVGSGCFFVCYIIGCVSGYWLIVLWVGFFICCWRNSLVLGDW